MEMSLTADEVLYLEALLRATQGSGGPIGLTEGEDLAQALLDKLETLEW